MIKKVNFIIRDYFGFSRIETRGLFFLLSFVCMATFITIYFEKTAFESYHDREADIMMLDSLMRKLESTALLATNEEAEVMIEKKLFLFDPNHASLEDFLLLGINEKLSNRILNFRNKGGAFYKPEDLLRIYDFPQPLYDELQPYITLPRKKKKEVRVPVAGNSTYNASDKVGKTETKSVEKELINFDINTVDSLQLSMLKGIGTVLSSRIVKYRDHLGGFHSKDQLGEVFNISELALQSLEEYVYVSKDFVPNQIKINEVDFKTLLKHPYIDYELAKSIMNHRRIYGNFSSPEQLKEVYHMEEELLVKLLPYLVI